MPEIQMPKLSDTMTEGTLVAWKKKKGDHVSAGQVLAEIETDKATMEWESPEDGTLTEIYVEEGGKVNVGDRDRLYRWRRRGSARKRGRKRERRKRGKAESQGKGRGEAEKGETKRRQPKAEEKEKKEAAPRQAEKREPELKRVRRGSKSPKRHV